LIKKLNESKMKILIKIEFFFGYMFVIIRLLFVFQMFMK